MWQINLSWGREIVGHVGGGCSPLAGYNLWGSSCRQVIRAAIWEQLIYCPHPAFSPKPNQGRGSVSKIRQWFTTLAWIWLHLLLDSSSTLSGVQATPNLGSYSSEPDPFKVINFGKLICFLGEEGSWEDKVGGGWLLILSISQRRRQSFPGIQLNCLSFF